MTKFDELKKSARETAKWRGHKLWNYQFTVGDSGIKASYTCKICGKMVFIITNPAPNGIDISGEAIALNCN